MSKLIEILPNVYGVKVPSDAAELELICLDSMYLRLKTNSEHQNIKLEFGTLENINIIGTLTKDEISFDASDVVDSTEIDIERYDGILEAFQRFWDYKLESFDFSSSDESFRSALPEEIYFENPLGIAKCDHYPKLSNNCIDSCQGSCWNDSDIDQDEWYNLQENITEKLLILQKTT